MARKANTRVAEQALETPNHEEAEPTTKSEVHHHAPAHHAHVPAPAKAHAAPPPASRRYRVLGLHQPKQVLMNGVMALIRPGKEVDESNHDIGLLQRLGLQLEEIK
jgi:hypothetical protein